MIRQLLSLAVPRRLLTFYDDGWGSTFVALEWKLQDGWWGVFTRLEGGSRDVWICLLPCFPLHVRYNVYRYWPWR
jgi:hypothetical protein